MTSPTLLDRRLAPTMVESSVITVHTLFAYNVVRSQKQSYGLQINFAEMQTSNENVHRKVRDREVLRRQDCILNATKYLTRA